jgi:hypothetical protein
VLRNFAIGLACGSLALAGCCSEWPFAPEVSPDHIVIYTRPPAHNYFELGTVYSPGGRIAADNYHRMQVEAACLGASGVILTDQIPTEDPDFWLYPHTGIAIVNATSSLSERRSSSYGGSAGSGWND